MKNRQALGEPDRAAAAKKWSALYRLVIVGLVLASVLMPANKAMAGMVRLLSFAMLIAWYFISGRPQIDFVKSRYGTDYPKKGWPKPLLIAVGSAIVFVLGIGAVGGIAVVALRTRGLS
jgi:hypothetical protein